MKQRSFLLLLIYAYMYIYLQIAGYTKPGLRQYEEILPLLDQAISQSLREGSLSGITETTTDFYPFFL